MFNAPLPYLPPLLERDPEEAVGQLLFFKLAELLMEAVEEDRITLAIGGIRPTFYGYNYLDEAVVKLSAPYVLDL